MCRTLGIDNLTNPTWKGVVPVHAVDEDLEAMNAVVKKLRGQKHALSIFWRSGWVDTVPALSVIGMGDSDRRDAALRVSRLFKHNTNAVHRGSTAVPAAARDDGPHPTTGSWCAVSLFKYCPFLGRPMAARGC